MRRRGQAWLVIPYNLADFGGRIAGMDAYFWGMVDVEARLVLLLRPSSALSREPVGEGRMLEGRVDVSRQLRDLEGLRGGLTRWAARHARWKLKRLLYPAREPPGGWEDIYASEIVGRLRPERARPLGRAWLLVSFDLEAGEARTPQGVDRLYTWLLRSDRTFRAAVAKALGGARVL